MGEVYSSDEVGKPDGSSLVEISGDISREHAMNIAESWAQAGFRVHFKFTCEACGFRNVLKDPNILYQYGECAGCGHETKLEFVGFLTVKCQ